MKAAVYRRETFNAAHRLHNPNWTDEVNRRVYGKCNNPNYHGHNYVIIVRVVGEIDPDTGFVMDLKTLRDLIHELVLDPFDHKNLNEDTEEFRELIPSAENIAKVAYEKLRQRIKPDLDVRITLYETEKNYVEYPL
ncbi:6-carboxy-5,6,7,8-tetrahydropterin synthase [Fulvitalea axinellae]|uniref:6-carboxy-5,6,7,8-tetrahydropterin synthase n=1 Tax=Fulvitalea axinellae TaxID=1182444 RepID=A0AAU9DDX0_9BACT|nr:6-carboxy-5,6,7,8-tetrahydropterin synthase [Fulvitalea axinellae]